MRIAIIGAGPAGLFAAETAATAGARVIIYDAMRLPGRKFLLAGRGGLNFTHGEELEIFRRRYRDGGARLRGFVDAFTPLELRAWADGLGAESFVGSSGRIFPKVMKASPLLRAWLQRLRDLGVQFVSHARMIRLEQGSVWIDHAGQIEPALADAIVVALGGASWPELGGDGTWAPILAAAGVEIAPLVASNAGARIDWPAAILALAGAPLKRVEVRVGEHRFRGEAILTQTGLEGGVIYQANAVIRAAAARAGWPVAVHLDVALDYTTTELERRLKRREARRSLGPWLRANLKLNAATSRLVSVIATERCAGALALAMKNLPLHVIALADIRRAISTAGGVAWASLNSDLSLRVAPNIFIAGEMIDWDAPTGGYLLQACFATGRAAGLGALAYARARLSDA